MLLGNVSATHTPSASLAPSHVPAAQFVIESQPIACAVGYVAAVLFCLGGAALYALPPSASGVPRSNLLARITVYVLLGAVVYPVACTNRIEWRRTDDGALVSFSLIALNVVTWALALVEVAAWYLGYDGAPAHWNTYDTTAAATRTLVAVLGFGALSSEGTRFVAVLAVLPLAVLLAHTAVVGAISSRRIATAADPWPPTLSGLSRARRLFLALSMLGIVTLALEMLSPAYGAVLSLGGSAVAMLCEHVALAGILLYAALDRDSPVTPVAKPPSESAAPPVADNAEQADGVLLFNDQWTPA